MQFSTSFLGALGLSLSLVVPAHAADSCQTGYTVCAPAGATSTTTPQIGSPDFANLLNDILGSSLPSSKRSADANSASLCCVSSLSCLALANLALPFCYDRFTTNFFLPDNSYGTVATGAYTSSGGDNGNLITGNYTLANGQTGNIYSSDPSAQPNSMTLVLPSQFTASGVGSAIPATALGGVVTLTYTTTFPASTIPASTILPSTVSGSTVSEVLTLPTTISTSISNSPVVSTVSVVSTEVSTLPPSTIQGTTKPATTVPAMASTVTTTSVVAPSSSSAAASSASASATKKSAAVQMRSGLKLLGSILIVAGFFAW